MSISVLSHQPNWRHAALALTMFTLGVVALPACAQPQSYPALPAGSPPSQMQPAGDPPSRVARLSDAAGQVWLSSLDSPEWISADRNRPLTSGDRLAVDKGGRAELTLGSTTLRLDEGTELEVTQLDDRLFAVQLFTGSVAARFRNPQSLAEFELDTDEGRFRVLQVGRYRFDRDPRSSDVTVYGGQAIFEGRNSALTVSAGQHTEFWLDAAGAAQYNIVASERDAFAAWNDERDRTEDRYASIPNRYVSPEMTGAQDLERYGVWQQDPDYGAIWIPRDVPVDWAPYSTGHWAFVQPWGWTWVDDAAWGFAPFHYGRWVNRRNVWCWTPGTYVARPIYAPALVAWVGGPRINASISIGRGRGDAPIGWFPLGPREVFVPSYRHSPNYVRNINIVHVTNVVNINNIVENRSGAADRRTFVNRESPHALTVVRAEVFENREPVRANASRFGDSPAMRALKDQRASPALSTAPVAAPAAPLRGNNNPDVRQRPPGFAATPRSERPERADRGGDPRNERGGFGRPQPTANAVPSGQAPTPGVAVQPIGPRGGQPSVAAPPALSAPNPNASPPNAIGLQPSGRGQPPQNRDRFGDRPPRPTTAVGPTPSPSVAPAAMTPPSTRPDVSQPAPAAVIPPPRERFQRPATPSERTPPPGQAPVQTPAVVPVQPPAQPAAPAVDNSRRPTSQVNEDARAAQRAERGERRERGEPGQAPSAQRPQEPVRIAPAAVAPPPPPAPVIRAAPPPRPAEARPAEVRPAEAPRAEPPAREERREERREPAR